MKSYATCPVNRAVGVIAIQIGVCCLNRYVDDLMAPGGLD